MKILLILTFSTMTILAHSQDTTYYDDKWYETKKEVNAAYYKVVSYSEQNADMARVTTFYKSTGKPRYDVRYSSYKNGLREGKERRWYFDGQLASEAEYSKGNLNGKIISYSENGEIKRQDVYKDGDFVEGKCFGLGGQRVPHSTFEMLPEFTGGIDKLIRYLTSEIKFPKKQRNLGVQGLVIVSFFILEDGSVANIHVIESPNEDFSKEAIRVVKKMPKWKPGVNDNKIEVYDMHLPINFTIETF